MCKTWYKFLYYYYRKIDYLFLTSTKFHFKSVIDKYRTLNQTLNHLCLAKFVTNCDMKTCKM
jgi:hypothetical protein